MPGRILIIDGIATNRISLRSRLCAAYYEVIQAATGAEGLTLLSTTRPDVVLISSTLPDMSACDLCRDLRTDPEHGDLPVIILDTAPSRDRRMAALKSGADDALDRHAEPRLLLARLRSLLRSGTSREDRSLHSSARASAGFAEQQPGFAHQPHIALVSEDAARNLTWMKRLQHLRPYRFSLHSPRALSLDFGQDIAPDAIVISGGIGEEPDFGAALLAALGSQPGFRRCKFLVALTDARPDSAIQMLDLGAHDLMTGPFDAEEAALRLDQLLRRKARSDQLHETLQNGLRAALIDPLTGLHNRRYAVPELTRLVKSATQNHDGLAVMLADLDHFKRLNDNFGHSAGDAVLAEVSKRMRNVLRPCDLLARFGGEEFLIAQPGLDPSQARHAADRVRQAISDRPIRLPGADGSVTITVSIGLALCDQRPADQEGSLNRVTRLLNQADQALYGAKAQGRNQVRRAA
ncbi:diguanylate cyclase domain-containing protein [Thalassovita sp.]|uniref:diguanylate cyclase domain-containing protein n=1 Tax=Thalassovita sp. TaxID=1979401 RepID=UPI002881582E|nr:diguanylate cyclase [Thalassovita sp.]MDF1801947.1 diguanylate cyclase [Thalassovita sp.]